MEWGLKKREYRGTTAIGGGKHGGDAEYSYEAHLNNL
jgi:hypothetical protein